MRDSYGREITYLRLSVTELCNFRCRYCMPEAGVCKKQHDQMLTEEEMITAVEAAASLGIRKLRITGGEPLVKKNIVSICTKAAAVGGIGELALTTNGVLLPKLAVPLREAGVKRVNISLDSLRPDRFSYITRGGSLAEVMRGIEAALAAGFEKVKLNTVLIGGFNDDEITQIADLTQTMPVDVRFIELMPMYDGEDFDAPAYISGKSVLQALPELIPVDADAHAVFSDAAATAPESIVSAANAADAEADNGVAKLYRLPGALGSVGVISPISDHFCGSCSRLRITADGKVRPCLHAPLEYNIKGLDKAGMTQQLRLAIAQKPLWHGDLSCEARSRAARNMNQIGG